MPILSIVVPVYKTEAYLRRCVDSLRAQTVTDLEIILVDDGSPDASPALCDALAQEDSRIKVVHKTNGGAPDARNAGMAVATGEYIGFVDSDDDVAPTMYETLLTAIRRDGSDIAMTDYLRIPAEGEPYLVTTDLDGGFYDKDALRASLFPQLILKETLDYGPLLSVWSCLYRAEFLRSHALRFDPEIRLAEDHLFSAVAGYLANRLSYHKDEGLYHYYLNMGSTTTSYHHGAFAVYAAMNEKLRAFFADKTDYDFSRQLSLHAIYYACTCFTQLLLLPKKERRKPLRELLHSQTLQQAFRGQTLPAVSRKLRFQLWLMKHRQVTLSLLFLRYRERRKRRNGIR